MVAAYTVDGESFLVENPRLVSEARFEPRRRTGPTRRFDLHPDGERFALAVARDTLATAKRDKVIFIFNFFDELRRLAPPKK